MDTLTADQRRELLQQVVNQPSLIDSLDIGQITELRKDINAVTPVFTEEACFANITLVNNRDSYFRALHTTALIGFLFRQAHTYENEAQRTAEMHKCTNLLKDMEPGTEEYATTLKNRDTAIENNNKIARDYVMKFLLQVFAYDPDRHVRSAHLSDAGATILNQREKQDNLYKRVNVALTTAPEIAERLKSSAEPAHVYTKHALMSGYNYITEASSHIVAINNAVCSDLPLDDQLGILVKNHAGLEAISADLKKLVEPLSIADTAASLRVPPSAEVFYHFDRYLQNNYEELRTITDVMYPYPRDVEFSLTLHSIHNDAAEAAEYVDLNSQSFSLPIQTISSNGTTLCGPFKQNREKIKYYGKNTQILEEMVKAQEAGAKLAADMVKKTVSREKKKNIEEAGADDPELMQYRKVMSQAVTLGAKAALTEEEKKELAAANKEALEIREDYEVPEDAIQFRIFKPEENPEGELVGIKSEVVYTQAEIPLHMDPSNGEEYQPVRAPGEKMTDSYVKKIVNVDGQKKIVTAIKSKK